MTKSETQDFTTGDRVELVENALTTKHAGQQGEVVGVQYGLLDVLFDFDTVPTPLMATRFKNLSRKPKPFALDPARAPIDTEQFTVGDCAKVIYDCAYKGQIGAVEHVGPGIVILKMVPGHQKARFLYAGSLRNNTRENPELFPNAYEICETCRALDQTPDPEQDVEDAEEFDLDEFVKGLSDMMPPGANTKINIHYPLEQEEDEGVPVSVGVNPKDAAGRSKVSVSKLPAVAVLHAAHAMMDGVEKYGAYNWRWKEVLASVYVDAATRHIQAWFEGQEHAADSQVHHLGHAIACLAILLDAQETETLVDDRPIVGYGDVADEVQQRLSAIIRRKQVEDSYDTLEEAPF